MAKYYNAEKLLEFVKQNTPHIDGETTMECVERAIKEAPTADVVEVVRCKDCKRFMKYADDGKVEGADGDCFIRMSHSLDHQFCAVKCTDFCSYGERRDT